LHEIPTEPTADTLSFYAVYMSHYISPKSVQSYLSGICHSLEPFHPTVRSIRSSDVVRRTLTGCLKRAGKDTVRKSPLSVADLDRMRSVYGSSGAHDDALWLAILFTGFNGLHRLGELVWPDLRSEQDYRKTISSCSLRWGSTPRENYSYRLPGDKGNRFFEGHTVLITKRSDAADAIPVMRKYIASRNANTTTRLHPALFVRADGSVPTRSWFLRRLRSHFGKDIAGHSIRSGGATDLALRGIADSTIQK
ncbi:hypothetical protein EXIGLDRAFT_587257, partial [Exidia glandulosa HHB12029]